MIRVYGRTTSTNTQKVLWALVESNLEYKLINTSGALGETGRLDGSDAYGFPSNYEAMNPSKTIPAIEFEDKTVEINEGEMIVVPRGVKHKPFAEEEAKIMLIEPTGTVNTGEIEDKLTAPNDQWI